MVIPYVCYCKGNIDFIFFIPVRMKALKYKKIEYQFRLENTPLSALWRRFYPSFKKCWWKQKKKKKKREKLWFFFSLSLFLVCHFVAWNYFFVVWLLSNVVLEGSCVNFSCVSLLKQKQCTGLDMLSEFLLFLWWTHLTTLCAPWRGCCLGWIGWDVWVATSSCQVLGAVRLESSRLRLTPTVRLESRCGRRP